MDQGFKQRLALIDWGKYHHPCGFDQREIPKLLIQIQSSDPEEASGKAQRLWNVVAHQGAACESAVPTVPFLMELLQGSPLPVQAEFMDILYQFSVHFHEEDWGEALHDTFEEYEEVFISRYPNTDEDIQSFAEMILTQMVLATARLSQPEGIYNRDLALKISGSPTRRNFTHPFKDLAANISSWIDESPVLKTKEPVVDASGWRVYNYPTRNGCQRAEVRISPTNEEAVIKTYWP